MSGAASRYAALGRAARRWLPTASPYLRISDTLSPNRIAPTMTGHVQAHSQPMRLQRRLVAAIR